MMTRKHFEKVAAILNKRYRADKYRQFIISELAAEFAEFFKSENPQFNKEKFMDAVVDETKK